MKVKAWAPVPEDCSSEAQSHRLTGSSTERVEGAAVSCVDASRGGLTLNEGQQAPAFPLCLKPTSEQRNKEGDFLDTGVGGLVLQTGSSWEPSSSAGKRPGCQRSSQREAAFRIVLT